MYFAVSFTKISSENCLKLREQNHFRVCAPLKTLIIYVGASESIEVSFIGGSTVSMCSYLRQLTGYGGRFGHVVGEGGLSWTHGGHAGQLRGGRGWEDGLVQCSHGQDQLQAVFYPKITTAVFPVL